MASNTHRLLDELEKLAYNGRIKRMYELGRVAANSAGNTKAAAEAKAVIAELWSGNFYQRQMALLSCHGSRDAQAVFNATSDNSELIRHYAISLASVMCSDEQVATIFVELHEKSQRFVLKALRRERRFALVDKLVAGLVNASTSKLLNAYFFASEDFVRKNFDLIEDRLAGEYMARFAYQHPKYAAAYLLQLAKASRTLDPRLVWLVNSALPRLAELIPDDALELVMEVIRTVPARQLSLSCMLRYRLDDTIGILHKRDALDSISFGSYLSKMSPESLSKVLQANALPRSRYSTLRRISSASASIIYSAVSEGWRDGSGCLPLELIDKLPESVRVLEAHKHLANPLVESRLAERFSYVRYLPWDEAVATLGELLNSQDVDNRALAFRSLIAVVRFHRQNRHELLELLIKRKNEPDPVRLETLAGIAALPPSIWQQENQEQINAIINNALSAPDLSDGSISYVAQFIVRALKFRTEWAQQWLGKLLKDRGSYILGRAGSHQLSESELRQLAPHLLPAVEHWHAREDSTHLVILAQWYGKKLRVFPQLIEALCSVTQKVKNESSAMRAAEALYSCARQDFGNLVPKLLKEDQSWGLTVPVYTFLHRIRQDLLTPYLGQNNLTGRLNRGKVRLVPNFNNGFYCWTTKQQNLYAEQLKLMAMDSKLAFHNRLFGLQRLVLLPEPPMDVLRKLAEIKSNEQQHVVTRDFVLGHLADLMVGREFQYFWTRCKMIGHELPFMP